MIDKDQWREFGLDTGVTPLLFTMSVMGFLMTTESQDLGFNVSSERRWWAELESEGPLGAFLQIPSVFSSVLTEERIEFGHTAIKPRSPLRKISLFKCAISILLLN